MTHLFKPVHVMEEPRGEGQMFQRCDWVDGAAVLIRSSLLPLPEDYFLYWEDVDLSLRARRAGMTVGVSQKWTALTTPGAGGRRDLFRYLYWRNRVLCSRRLGGLRGVVGTTLVLAGAAVVRPGQRLLARDFRGARKVGSLLTRALLDGLRGRSGPPPPLLTSGSDVQVGRPTDPG